MERLTLKFYHRLPQHIQKRDKDYQADRDREPGSLGGGARRCSRDIPDGGRVHSHNIDKERLKQRYFLVFSFDHFYLLLPEIEYIEDNSGKAYEIGGQHYISSDKDRGDGEDDVQGRFLFFLCFKQAAQLKEENGKKYTQYYNQGSTTVLIDRFC